MTVIAATGHRPDKLGGYGDDVLAALIDMAVVVIRPRAPTAVISGMALGWDTAVALAALRIGVPLIAAVPFPGQEARWPGSSQQRFAYIMEQASRVETIRPRYSADAFQARNVWMVDNSDHLLALWDGSGGGTCNCVQYARSRGIDPENLWPLWQGWSFLA